LGVTHRSEFMGSSTSAIAAPADFDQLQDELRLAFEHTRAEVDRMESLLLAVRLYVRHRDADTERADAWPGSTHCHE
jgi:hypothetical protein